MRLTRRNALTLLGGGWLSTYCSNSEPASDGVPAEESFLLADLSGLSRLNLPSGTRTPLLAFDDRSQVFDPSVSPDGTHLAFARQFPTVIKPDGSADFGSDLYLARSDGTDVRELARRSRTGEFLTSSGWLDNQTIVFAVRGPGGNRLGRIDIRTARRAIPFPARPRRRGLAGQRGRLFQV